MKRKITYLVFAFWILNSWFSSSAFAQSLAPMLIGTTGNFSQMGSAPNWYISSSVGEPVVTTVSSGTLTLTQGFQQTFAAVTITGITALPKDTICKGNNTTLVSGVSGGAPPLTYAWTPNDGSLSCNNCQNPVATPTITTTYTLIVSEAGPSSDTATITIKVSDPTVTIAAVPNDSVCYGSIVTLTASATNGFAPYNYAWAPDGQITPSITALATSTQTYFVSVNDKYSCSGVATQTITALPTPTVSFTSGSTTICSGNNNTLAVGFSGGTGPVYNWIWNASAGTLSCTTCMGAIASTTVNTTYSVSMTDTYGCMSNTATFSVSVAPLPTATISASPQFTICNGQSTTLNASSSGASTYSWSTGATTTTITVSPTTSTGYTLFASSAVGCVGITSKTVTVNSVPTATISVAPSLTVCSGQVITLTNNVSGGTGPYSYTWSFPGGTTQSITDTASGSIMSYGSTVTDANTCTVTTSAVVNVNSTPTVSVSPAGTTICSGSSTTLNASGANTYVWSPSASLSTPNISNPAASPTSTITYSVTGTSSSCSDTKTVTVTVDQAPDAANAGADQTLCGTTTTTVVANTPTSPSTGLWTVVSGTGTIVSPSSPTSSVTGISGTLTLKWIISNGVCASTTDFVVITANPALNTTSSTTNATCNGNCNGTATVIPSGGTSPYTYLWNDPSAQITQTATGLCANNFTATVTDQNGCTATNTVTVTQPAVLNANSGITNVSCFGACDGTGSAAPSGGTAPYTYAWSNGQTTSAATGLCAGGYTLNITDSKGCLVSSSGIITEPAALAVSPVDDTTSCASNNDGAVDANPSGGTAPYTFSWNDPGNQTTQIATGLSAGNYSVNITDANGCANTATVAVVAGPVLTVSLTASSFSVCSGSSVTLAADDGGAGASYAWSVGGTTSSITVNPTVQTTYSVNLTLGSCQIDTSLTIYTNPTPSVSISITTNNPCTNTLDTLMATVSGGTSPFSYSWNTGATTDSIFVIVTGNTTYTCSVTDALGCTATNNFSVGPASTPTATISGNMTVCAGTNVALNATGGTSYSWSNGGTTNTTSVSPTITTSYTVTVANSSGCTDTATTTITVTSTPTVSVSASATTICSGSTVTLTGSTNGATYVWSPGGQSTSLVLTDNPTSLTTYSLVAYNGACTDTTTQTINVSSVTASISGTASVCVGDAITLGASGGSAYVWSGPGGFNSTLQNPTIPSASTANGGTYTVTVTGGNNCTDTATITITVNPVPSPVITAASPSVCVGSNASLSASGGNTYLWNPGSQTNSVITPLILNNITYTVTAFNGSCSASATFSISALPLPPIGITSSDPDLTICPGDVDTLTGTGGLSYYWGTQFGTPPFIVVTPGTTTTYTVIGQGANGCYNIASATVIVSNLSANAGSDITICPGFTAHLLATVSGDTAGAYYLWSPFDGSLNDSTAYNPSANPDSTTVYAVEVYNALGCWAKDSVTVFIVRDAACVIHIYNGITPNGDGDNDIWYIDGIQSFPENKVLIFNRWGTRVWEGTNYDNDKVVWRGENEQGITLPDGTYYYIVELYDSDGSVLYSASKWVEVTH